MNDQKAATPSDTVPALRRTVLVMDLLALHPNGLTAAAIVRELQLPKSSAHGLLGAMIDLSLITRSRSGTIQLGSRALQWSNAYLSHNDVLSVFSRYLTNDRSFRDFTVTLSIRDKTEVVYIACQNSEKPLGHTFQIGMRLPAPFTATGKVLLSECSETEIDVLFEKDFPEKLTVNSVSSLDELRRELDGVRRNGFSLDNGQIRSGMICIGAGIRGVEQTYVAGIAVSMLESEVDRTMISAIGGQLIDVASNISRNIGWAQDR